MEKESQETIPSSKGGRSSREKYLIGAVVVLALTAIGLLIGLIVVAVADDENDNVCMTPGCVETANMLLKNMNMDADP